MIALGFPIKTYYLASSLYTASFIFQLLKRKRIMSFFLFLGFLTNLISEISMRYITWPFCNMFSEPYFLPLFFSFFWLVVRKRKEADYLPFLIFVSSATAVFFSENYYPPYTLMSKSIYSHIFHLLVFCGHALIFLEAYLCLFKVAALRLTMYGFLLLCIAGFFGMIWSWLGRGDIISWNHYYFHNIGLWFYYIGFFHLYSKKKALLLLGAILIFFLDYMPQIGGLHIPLIKRLDGLYG